VQSWIGPANVDANYVLGLCYMHTQNYEEARRSFAQMYGVAQDSAPAHLFLARMLLRQGYDPIAEQNAQQAAAMDAKLPLVHYLLGEFYLYKSNVQKAIDEFELEQKLNPAYAGTYDRLGDSYSRLGRYDDAERALQRAILLDATATGPYILMGKVLSPEGITHGPIELHVTSFDGRSVSRSWAHRGRGTGIEKIRGTSVGSGIEASGINQVIGYGGQVTGRR